MAPKDIQGKKKGGDGRKKRKVSQSLDAHRFVNMDAQERYYDLYEDKGFIPERNINLRMPEDNPIMRTIRRRQWEVLVSYAEPASGAIVKEFCANAELEDLHITKMSRVRGIDVHFDIATIEFYLLTNFNQAASCEYISLYNRLQPSRHRLYRDDFPELTEMVRTGITTPYSKWDTRAGDFPEKLFMKDLTGECRFWHNFVNANILPSSNLTDVNIERAALLYILTGEERLNIAAALSDRICYMVRGSRKKELLGFASLINHLCTRAGVYIPDDEELDVKPASEMTLTTYIDHCSRSEVELRKKTTSAGVGRPPSPRVPRVPIPVPGPAPGSPPPIPAAPPASADPVAPQGFPRDFDLYGLQQQLHRISIQNEVIIMQGEYHSRFMEHAFPSVPFTTFQPVYPAIPPPYQQPYPSPPPADVPMPPQPFRYQGSQHPVAASSYAPRRVVMDESDDSDE